MKRLISVVLAVVLGITVMVLPILLVTPSYQYGEAATSTEKLSVEPKEETRAAQAVGGSNVVATVFPTFTQAGLVVIAGLIIAFGISLYVKKKVLPPF